ncbi:MAG: monovalent cation/H+ antiporter subunit D family protein [Planctomycetes bacterium]|nr:monovalent cation/H+ antiporter subunit D family protein [Planctomycetota bacterium]
MDNPQFLPLFVALPLAAAFLIPLLSRLNRALAETSSVVTGAALLLLAIGRINAPAAVYNMGDWRPPFGINIVSDSLSSLMLLLIAAISLCVIVYALSYMKSYTARPKFYTLLMLMIAGMNGVVLSGDIFNLYVFLEIAAISSYALVAFGTEDEELEAAFKYLVLGGVASSFILLGIAFLYSLTGTLNLAQLAQELEGMSGNRMLLLVSAFFIMGFGLKAALVPFHAWLPDAHPSAPAPISAMLSGLLIKALGVYVLIRLFYTVLDIGPVAGTILMVLGLLSMVIGVFLAVGQWDFKRLLAYHSISQMGYVMLGIGLGTPLGIAGAIFHLINHGVFKSLLFLCSGAVENRTGTRNLKELSGLCHRMPVTSASCCVASLSISGVPPFNGFWSKLIIIVAAVQASTTTSLGNVAYVIAGITVLVSFMTLVSFAKVQKYVLFGKLPERLAKIKEVPAAMCVSLIVLAILCLSLGVLSPIMLKRFIEPARDAAVDRKAYIERVFPNTETKTAHLGD